MMSPKGQGRGDKAVEFAVEVKREVAEEGDAVAAAVVVDDDEENEKESLLELPKARSRKRDAIVTLWREREGDESEKVKTGEERESSTSNDRFISFFPIRKIII